MKGIWILIVFFSIFLAASLLIPSPMFPGNVICSLIGEIANEYSRFLSAVFNGVFYAVILWLIFISISRKPKIRRIKVILAKIKRLVNLNFEQETYKSYGASALVAYYG